MSFNNGNERRKLNAEWEHSATSAYHPFYGSLRAA